MSNNKDIQDLIDAYLKGELRGQELVDFEKSITENPALKVEIEKTKAVNKLVIQHRLLDVKKIAQLEEAKLKGSKNTLLKGIIGGLIGISILGAGTLYFQKEANDEKLPSSNKKDKSTENFITSVEEKSKPTNLPKDTLPEVNNKKTKKAEALVKEVDKSSTKDTSTHSEQKTIDKTSSDKITVDSTIIKEETEKDKSVKTEVKNTSEVPQVTIKPCDTTTITIKSTSIATCKGKEEGEIVINGISGGKAPYQKTLLSFSGEEVYSYANLKSGKYTLSIKDRNSCTTDVSVVIKEKNCPINDHFNPSMGQVWEIPSSEKNGKITIFTRNGSVVYEQQLYADEPSTWDGYGNNGSMPAGYYIFVIEYRDGDQLKGSITISE